MKKFTVLSLIVLLLCFPFFSGCSNVRNMVVGQWKLEGITDDTGKMSESMFSVAVEIYKDGSVDLLGGYYGKYTIDRSNFTFEGRDGDVYYSGSFDVNATELYLYLDQQNMNLYFTRVTDTGTAQ
ncbi:MAG: hypothetical protein PHO66_05975 [Eubacteriales bacterium]|nr:hypothetical protein [Eubacteriales bacterium]